jgi:hypothetical protein
VNQRSDLPVLTVDMDGVFCSPILGWNVGIHRTFLDPEAEPPLASPPPRWLGAPLDHLRFDLRVPLAGSREALERLRAVRQLVVVTGRRTYPSWWMRRHGFAALFDRVLVNETHFSSPHYKLEAVGMMDASEHIDDDPRTAQLLAQRSRAQVFLREWPKSRGVERVRDLSELADRLSAP